LGCFAANDGLSDCFKRQGRQCQMLQAKGNANEGQKASAGGNDVTGRQRDPGTKSHTMLPCCGALKGKH